VRRLGAPRPWTAPDDGHLATFWVHRPDRQEPLGSRWRVDIPARHLPAEVVVYGRTFKRERQRGGAAVFVAPHFSEAILAFNAAKVLGLRTVVEVDDNWLELDPRFLALQQTDVGADPEVVEHAMQVHRDGQRRHRWAAEQANAVIVSTPALAELYAPLSANVHVCPNSLDVADWPEQLRQPRERGPFVVGFAGSTSHADDLPLIRDALAWASEQPGVEARFLGWHPADASPSWETESARRGFEEMWAMLERGLVDGAVPAPVTRAAQELIDVEKTKVAERQVQWDFPLEVVPWTEDAMRYADNLAALDVGLCPVDDAAPFSAGRSDLKVLELAAAGVLPIVSDHPIYAEWRGLVPMARSPEEFVELTRWAVEHPDEVRSKAAELWQRVLETRAIETTIGRWRDAVASTQARAAA
jgi:hypothetical protein